MTSRSRTVKRSSAVTYKPIHRKRAKLSVTRRRRGDVTPSVSERPAKRYERLKPWLELANLSALEQADSSMPSSDLGVFLKSVSNAPDFPADKIRQFFKDSIDRDKARQQINSLAQDVALAFLYCAGENPEGLALGEGPHLGVRFVVKDGRFEVDDFDPYRDQFLPAIRGMETARIGRCPICEKLFFALRYNKKESKGNSKACSKRCNQVRRVREWRKGEARHNLRRKLKDARSPVADGN